MHLHVHPLRSRISESGWVSDFIESTESLLTEDHESIVKIFFTLQLNFLFAGIRIKRKKKNCEQLKLFIFGCSTILQQKLTCNNSSV